MITSLRAFLRYFDAVHRRAMRDIGALPDEADGWTPAAGTGENAWSINQLVGHMAGSRLYFASAYRGEGWISPPAPDVSARDRWLPARRIWNQHSYHVTNVREDGSIPQCEPPHWRALNTFRAQARLGNDGRACRPDPRG